MRLLLDISRFCARLNHPVQTGVQRVENALLVYALDKFPEALYVAKIGQKQCLFDADGVQKIKNIARDRTWDKPKGIDRFRLKLSPLERSIRTTLRRLSLSHARNFRSHLKLIDEPVRFITASHANGGSEIFEAVKNSGGRVELFIHDLIPLNFPEYSRPHAVGEFKAMLSATKKFADRIWVNSEHTKEQLNSALGVDVMDHVVVQKLGVELPAASALPFDQFAEPYFVSLGTLEPRKNVEFLLDLWRRFETNDDRINLVFVGKRGWETPEFFQRFDAEISVKPHLFHFDTLDDGQMVSLIQGAHGVLCPSLEEGFGLPVAESLSLSIPVIANDIPVFRELFSNHAQLVSVDDPDQWERDIRQLAQKLTRLEKRFSAPSWKSFAEAILSHKDQGNRP